MSTRGGGNAFNGGDPTSRYLIDLAADRVLSGMGDVISAGTIELAQRHGLIPLLAEHHQGTLIRAVLGRETARIGVLERHLGVILKRLHEARVRAAVLKGPAVALEYRHPSLRPFSDLDLLVPEEQVEEALGVLADYPATLAVPEKRPKADKRDVLMGDESGIRFNLDLHWDLFSYSQLRGSADGATAAAWDEAVLVPDSPLGPHWRLPDGQRLAFLASHAILDHRFRLILFRDLLELSRGDPDWGTLVSVAGRWGLRSTSYLAFWLARHVLDAEVPGEVLDALRPSSLPVSFLEWALPRVDLVRFDGHRPHPVNLASVLLNDSAGQRLSLLLRAPAAFPGWRQRVTGEHLGTGPPRTLILASTDRRRGAEVFSERLGTGLLRRGWVVEAVALRGHGEQPRAELEPLVDTDSSRRFDPTVARRLRQKIAAYRPDVVVANGGATLRYAVAARPGNRFRLVYVAIGEPGYWLRSGASRRLNRFLLRRVDRVIAVSDATKAQLLVLEPSLTGRVVTGYTGVPDHLFGLARRVEGGPLHVLMVGSLTEEKDPALALRAVAAVPEALLRLVGSGPLREDLERLAVELGISDRVEFAGSVADVAPQLEWADVLILTSLSEGLPGAILEASAAGRPTVSVDVGGVGEVVIDGVTGFVTSRDHEDLARALKTLDADRAMLTHAGTRARELASRRFRLDAVVDRWAAVLEEDAG